eukprot:GHVR01031967.1.p1 GENE.GHVR01031967.1~~GHVR01031967.1.p1  ORF type:complete len:545 (+),score=120.84 GHVR01031967.1:122-1756(+)
MRVGTQMETLFEAVVQYAQRFTSFATIYTANEKTTIDDFVNMDAGGLFDALEKYKHQQDMVAALTPNIDLGLFRLDIRDMITTLRPSPIRCWSLLTEYVPKLTLKNTQTLTDEIGGSIDKLQQQPNTVDEYVSYMQLLTSVSEGLSVTEASVEEVKELARTLSYFSIKFESKPVQHVSKVLSELKAQIQTSSEQAEGNTMTFVKELDKDIPMLKQRVDDVSSKLDVPMFSDPNAPLESVLDHLSKLETLVVCATDDAARVNRYQEVLKLDQTSFEGVDDLKIKFAMTAKLWRAVKEWGEKTSAWNDTKFMQVEIDTVTKEVQQSYKLCVQSEKAMPGNPAVDKLKLQVSKFRNTLPVVQALRNQALQPRHWERVYELIGSELDIDDPEFTLGSLLGMGVDSYMEEIQDISVRASAEASLEEMLSKVEKVWQGAQLNVSTYKEHKDIFILGSIEDVTQQLEESLVCMSTIAGSRYVAPIRDRVESWQKSLLLFQDTLDEWLQVQRNWMYLESIFNQGDIRKQMPNESAKFVKVDGLFVYVRRSSE